MLKKLYVEKDHIRLQPANPDMAPFILRQADIEVPGIVKVIVRRTWAPFPVTHTAWS